MKRREAVSTISLITGGAIMLPQAMLSGCDRGPYKYELFNWGDTDLLDEIADMIIPSTTGVPGAKTANVGDFIQLYVTDCFKLTEQQVFLEGFQKFKITTETQFGDTFSSLTSEKKLQILDSLETESKEFQKNVLPGEPGHFYSLLKETVLFGYFTSEIGATKALRYLPVPGYQKGEIPYNGEKAWAL